MYRFGGRLPHGAYSGVALLSHARVAECGSGGAERLSKGESPAGGGLCVVARHLRVDTDQQAPRFLRALARGVKTLFRFAERNWSRALNSGSVVKGGPRSDLRIQQMTVRLRGESIRDINRRIDELTRFLDEADDDSSRAFYVVTVAISPVMETSVKA